MLRTNRLTSVLAGRGKAVAAAGAAAAVLAGAGAASAATLNGSGTASAATVTSAQLNTPGTGAAAAVLTGASSPATLAGTASAATLAPAATAAPKPAAHTMAADPAAKATKTASKPAASPARPYEIYDSVTPSQIPAHARIATYADGGYAVAPSQVAGRGHVLWIDTSGADPRASALDVEPGDATPAMAATWAWHKLHAAANSVAIIYTMRSEWAAAQAAVATLPAPMQHQVRWWIADPTGVPHIVPGASATQWYWGHNYDITTAKPGF
jgi:hypothetical protein